MANLVVLVIRPLPVKAKHRNPILVLHDGIELAVALVIRNHLAPTREIDRGAVVAAIVVLEGFPVTAARRIALDSTHESVTGRVQATSDLDVISAREVELPVVDPPRHVDVISPDPVLVVRDVVHHLRDESSDIGAGRVGEIPAD